ncbi:MAG: hypothetical protein ACRDIE_06720 [Chloroflexota bacterium]
MATLGVDCQVILDGAGYFVEPAGYVMKRPRLRKAVITKSGAERYIDLGPGKREWRLRLLCVNGLLDYTGAPLPATGKDLRDRLRAAYEKTPAGGTAGLTYTDLDGMEYTVHFDDYEEEVRDPRTQLTSPGFHVAVVLVEA